MPLAAFDCGSAVILLMFDAWPQSDTKIVHGTAATAIINIMACEHARDRSHRTIHPPFKNVNITLGVKSIAKMCFPR